MKFYEYAKLFFVNLKAYLPHSGRLPASRKEKFPSPEVFSIYSCFLKSAANISQRLLIYTIPKRKGPLVAEIVVFFSTLDLCSKV